MNFSLTLLAAQQPAPAQPAPPPPVIVKIIEPPKDPTGIADVLIGSIGLTGAILVLAMLVGVIFAGVLFWIRRRST